MALSSMLLTNSAFGEQPIVQEVTIPSKQSINGDKYTLLSGNTNSVISVSNFWYGLQLSLR